ncbi:hypothetical protein AAG906_016079 [Vitis piasezkii]
MSNEVPSYIANNPKYFPWFKDCIRAIDGTHVSAWVLTNRQASFKGTTNDARVFLDALTRPEIQFPWPTKRKILFSGFRLSLYIWISTTISWCFGVLKASFPILRMMPSYKPSRQPSIVVSCCTLHNWIRLSTRNDQLFRQYEVEDLLAQGEEVTTSNTSHFIDLSDESAVAMATCRDEIAQLISIRFCKIS